MTSRSLQASHCYHCCASQATEADGRPSGRGVCQSNPSMLGRHGNLINDMPTHTSLDLGDVEETGTWCTALRLTIFHRIVVLITFSFCCSFSLTTQTSCHWGIISISLVEFWCDCQMEIGRHCIGLFFFLVKVFQVRPSVNCHLVVIVNDQNVVFLTTYRLAVNRSKTIDGLTR